VTIGFYINRLFGLFSSPNVGGLFALILLWCSLVTLYLRKGEKRYKIWVAVAVIQMILAAGYISVALSRGANVVGIGFVIVFMILRPATGWEQRKSTLKQFALRAVSAVLALAFSVCAVSAMQKLLIGGMELTFSYKYGVEIRDIASLDPEDPNLSEEERKAIVILQNAMLGFDGRVEAGREDIDITNKRADIWKAHLSILTGKNLLTGVNDPYLWYKEMTDNGVTFTEHQKFFIEWAGGNMHNGFLQILVNCGLFALVAMLVFLALCFIRCLRYFWRSVRDRACIGERYHVFALSLPMVLCILGNNFVETNFVLMGANFFQALFWVLAGAAVLIAGAKQEEVK
jgi:O-antigen ligase